MPQYKIKAKIWSTKNDENNKITLIIDTLKPYKISIHEIEYLKKEINTARIHIEQINNNFDNQIKQIELEKNKLLSRNHENKERQIEDARNKYRPHYENYINYDTYTNMIFNRNKHREIKDKFDHARYELESAELHANMNYDDEKKKIIYEFDKKLTELDKKRAIIKWWENLSFKLLQRTVTRRNKEVVLGSKLPINDTGLIIKALDIYKIELEKKEHIDTLKAKAAAADKKSRQLAISVKRKISNQIKILNVCPYCGNMLNIDTAHADHIYPVSKGGQSTRKNMVYVCDRCNLQKKDFTLNKFIQISGYKREDIENRLDLLHKDY